MRVDIGGGVRLFVDIDGLGLVPEGPTMVERPTVLFLHGGPGLDHSLYKASTLLSLTDVAQLVFYDHRGQGRSDIGSSPDWTLDIWADDVVRLCDALGIDRPIVYGASFGGMVAQRYIARHPEHPAKVVLACTSARLDVDTIAEAFEKVGGAEAASVARRFWENDLEAFGDYIEICMPLYSVAPPDPEVMGRMVMNIDVLQHFQNGEQHTMDLRAGLASARCPVLVLGGGLDPVTPLRTNEEVAASLPSELMRFEHFGDLSHREVGGNAGTDLVRAFITG
ncbi:alpha/beta hydrolase [Iamia sp.]|uniref:alpha/beta fold hydrolase n=1 Tax=Iamia sp. TaxID=2722710 RepID=UPI002BAFC047|nr:alpha/beta hydrolase [Iamia sp.]HXH56052.1 alpha/beta hydrolase [Iamia sp.]